MHGQSLQDLPMTASMIALMFIAAFFSGAINAIAGGGTFLTFGVLTLAGVPPISANATSSIVQFPGYVTSTLAYFKDLSKIWKEALVLGLISIVGSALGALYLVWLSDNTFKSMVPWLLLAATVVFAAGPWLKPRNAGERHAANPLGIITQTFTSFYGGFFGAGMGIMMLASLGVATGGDYHRLNALKNFLAIVIAAVAIVVFSTAGAVAWYHAAVMVPGCALGGYAGIAVAKRVSQVVLRWVVIAAGLGLSVYYFVQ
jgi:uncharacterized membrane protein YfcA